MERHEAYRKHETNKTGFFNRFCSDAWNACFFKADNDEAERTYRSEVFQVLNETSVGFFGKISIRFELKESSRQPRIVPKMLIFNWLSR